MKASFEKFHPDEELILFSDEEVKATGDKEIFYRATPRFAKELFERGYTEVCKLDSDQIITGNLDHIWEGDFDVGCVKNANPREFKTYPVTVWNIDPLSYLNNGFVVLKSPTFVVHWLRLCYSPHFNYYQMREQDILNIMVYYMNNGFGGPYKIRILDDGDKWHGLIAKQYEPYMELRGGKLILPKNEEWPKDSDKQIVCWHSAGGHNNPDKLNYRIRFKSEVVKWIDKLVKPNGTAKM